MDMKFTPGRRLYGRVKVPGEKSVSHQALILGLMGMMLSGQPFFSIITGKTDPER